MVKMQHTPNILNNFTLLAADYDCNAYNSGAYNNTDCNTTASTPSGGLLSDTGYNVIIPVALGLAIILASLILLVTRFLRHRRQRKTH
jgi:hypothetical protein